MIKKEKVFELKIEEHDDVSGIDSISLVDEPAIEVNWVSFSKEKFGGKVSFDYDGTLDTAKGRLKAEELIKNGYDVYIVTARNKGESGPVYRIADQLGIPHDKVHFTNGRPKSDTLKLLGIQKHYDNNPDVIDEIKNNAPNVDAEQFDYNVGSIGGYVDPGIGKK